MGRIEIASFFIATIKSHLYLKMFLETAFCSNRTTQYYESTLMKMISKVDMNVTHMTTDDLRTYLTDYQKINNCSKTNIDNIRRNLSSFFSWLEEENYILKSPMKRIHKIKTDKVVKETLLQ